MNHRHVTMLNGSSFSQETLINQSTEISSIHSRSNATSTSLIGAAARWRVNAHSTTSVRWW